MYKFWCYYIRPKYQNNVKICPMDTDSSIIHIKTENVYEDIVDDVENKFDTSKYEVNKKVIRFMKDELGRKIITEFVAIRPKRYSYLMDDGNSDKKA